MARLKVSQFGIDAEQAADEIFHVGGDFDDQLGTGFIRQSRRILTGGEEPGVQFRKRLAQLAEKNPVELSETFVREKVVKSKSKRQS
jgi:hypothetical protein